jgi:genome maintenance exonuclease 1
LAAYAMAHNFVYKTEITKGVVMMCSKDNFYQEFVVEGEEFQQYKFNFLRRVDEYFKSRHEKTG